MAEYTININVNDVSVNATTGETDKKDAKSVTTKTLITFEQGKSIAKNILMGLSSQVGTITGSPLLQSQVNGALMVGRTAASIAANPILGTINTLISLGNQAIQRDYEIFWKNTQASEYRRRSGNYLGDRNR